MTKRKIEYWVIPPDADGEFVANMEEVLETYEKAYDPANPVVCMDEQPVQLIGETRVPIPPTKEHPERVDYEYERKGTASIFGSSAESVGEKLGLCPRPQDFQGMARVSNGDSGRSTPGRSDPAKG